MTNKKTNAADSETVSFIYSKYKNYMYSVAKKYTPNPDDWDDIIQTTVVRLLLNASTLRQLKDGTTVSYLNLTVRSVALDFLEERAKINDPIVDESPEHAITLREIKESISIVEETVLRQEKCRTIKAAVNRMPEKIRLIIIGKYYLELDDDELAASLGYKRNSVRTAVYRARQMLLAELEKEETGDDRTDQTP